MSERRTVEPSLFLSLAILFLIAGLWAIAGRLGDIHNDLRAAIAIDARQRQDAQRLDPKG